MKLRYWWFLIGGIALALIGGALQLWVKPARTTGAEVARTEGVAVPPLLAYYYIWFEERSWRRAKTDLPLLGTYSSDDRSVMQQHIRWAKESGINGFLVSWKSTPPLNRRLAQLAEVAAEEGFKLGFVYQGLDFNRNPLPPERIAADLDYLATTYGADPVFDIFGRPLVVWSGSWKFSPEEIASVTASRRKSLLLLASERSPGQYQRLAALVDGNAYYWSSVDPRTFPGYLEKLKAMEQAVHSSGGIWIAPAAPGFDARLIGGREVVEREDGATLRIQLNSAAQASPDAIGLISWNEFSEHTHIEPSNTYGRRYLELLADIRGVAAPAFGDGDSSEGAGAQVRPDSLVILAALGALTLASIAVVAWRGRRR